MDAQEIKNKRQDLERRKYCLKRSISHFDEIKKDLIKMGGKEYAEQHLEYLKAAIEEIDKEDKAMPIGHLYEGVYYKKCRDHSVYPAKEWYEKKEGRLFMRTDIISWKVPNNNWDFHRNLFKDENQRIPLKREEGKPIYSREEVKDFL